MGNWKSRNLGGNVKVKYKIDNLLQLLKTTKFIKIDKFDKHETRSNISI